jgi:membrane-associated protease RseP (regulator of RpoE activity)
MPESIVFKLLLLHLFLTLPHELGHFAVARLVGVAVPEFGIGLPPTLVAARWRGTRWSLNLLPLGAFIGYNAADARPAMRRTVIAVAGPLANLLVGLVCLVLISAPTFAIPLDLRWMMLELGRLWGPWNGVTDFLRVLLAASVAVGCVNLLPIPPMDGGKLLFVALRSVGCGPEIERRAGRVGLAALSVLATAGLFVIVGFRS